MRKVVIVTGASRGLGRAIALKFGREDWCVAVNYLASDKSAKAVCAEIMMEGGEAFHFKADVRHYAQVESMVKETMSRWGRVDALINNAGISREGLIMKVDEPDLREVMDTNLKGCFNTIKAVSGIMQGQGGGHIINISSIIGIRGKTGQAAYCASKSGLLGLTKAAAIELAPYSVRVNAVLPGYMLTDMGNSSTDKARHDAISDNLLKKYSEPSEVAGFVYSLAGMKAVSGQVFNIDSRIIL